MAEEEKDETSTETTESKFPGSIQQMQNERLRSYYMAEMAVLSGQSYTIGNRTLTRANLAEIRSAIDDLLAAGASLDDSVENRARRSFRIVFHD